MTALFLFVLFIKAMDGDFQEWFDKVKKHVIIIYLIVAVIDWVIIIKLFNILRNGTN